MDFSPQDGLIGNNETDGIGKKVVTLNPPVGEEDSSDSESEDEISAAEEEADKFETLCDGVLQSMALVQAALAEFLDLKDELLPHALPPSLKERITMIAGRLLCSTTDMYTPTSELVRLVRVYSGSWEEKSQALKKLHSDYDSKHKQLNIAIRRLQLADAQAKRIAHEKRIMNWEKLFARLTSSRGHGRRWRFMIGNLKQKAKLGMENLHAYIDGLDKEKDSDNDDENKKKDDTLSHASAHEFDISSSELSFTEADSEGEEADEEDGASTARATAQTTHAQREIGDSDVLTPASSKKVTFQRKPKHKMRESQEKAVKQDINPPATIVEPQTVYVEVHVPAPKLPSADKVVWTHEPQYDYKLNIRLHRPVGLEHKHLKCSVNFIKTFRKSDVFDEDTSSENGKSALNSSVKPKSMIGSKGSPAANSKNSSSASDQEKVTPADSCFYDVCIPIGDQPISHGAPIAIQSERIGIGAVTTETSSQSRPASSAEEPMRIAVHSGELEDMIALATVGIEDLHSMDIEIIDDIEKLTELKPSSFPLYPINMSHKDRGSAPVSCGSIPIAFYYTRVHQPFVHDKQTESESVMDIVLDLTGVDLNKMNKEDLPMNKTYEERCISAMTVVSNVSSEKPEMVLRAELDTIVEQHNQELTILQEEYEQRLNELATNLEKLQNDQLKALLNPPKSANVGHQRHMTSPLRAWTADSNGLTKSTSAKELRPSKSRGKRPANLPNWGSEFPKDFFERLKLFSEEGEVRRRQLIERTKSDMEDRIVKQLAGQYKLNLPTDCNADANKEICLPAVFMPTKTGQLYNPRAHSYFHPTGSSGQLRLTQPPSIFQLPPLPSQNKFTVINLFDIQKNFEQQIGAGGDWHRRGVYSSPAHLSQPNIPLSSHVGTETKVELISEQPRAAVTE